MREIKFRAWDSNSSTMITEPAFISVGGDGTFQVFIETEPSEWIGDKEGVFLMQYTGLKDRNGKEIYEGDIVQDLFYVEKAKGNQEIINSGRGIIKWIPCGFAIHYYGINILNLEYIDENDKLEVIGNIHEQTHK